MSIESRGPILFIHCKCDDASCVASSKEDNFVLKTQKIDGGNEIVTQAENKPMKECEIFNNHPTERKAFEIINRRFKETPGREMTYVRDEESGRMMGKRVEGLNL